MTSHHCARALHAHCRLGRRCACHCHDRAPGCMRANGAGAWDNGAASKTARGRCANSIHPGLRHRSTAEATDWSNPLMETVSRASIAAHNEATAHV